jgi:tetratricopeptide (TPR) repeat protein
LKHREKAAPELVGRVLLGAGEIAAYAVDLERAVALNEESLELHHRLGDKHGMAAALNFLAIGLLGVDVQDRRGLSYFRESLELSRQTDDVRFTAEVMGNLGLCLIEQGNIEEGRRLNEQSLGILVDAGDLRGASRVYENLARVAFYSSDFAAAAGLWSDGLLLLRERSDPRTIIFHLVGLAAVAAQSGDISRAATLAGASTAIRAATGSPTFADEAEFYDRYVEMPRTRANPELWEPAWSEGQAMSMEQALAYALDETD